MKIAVTGDGSAKDYMLDACVGLGFLLVNN